MFIPTSTSDLCARKLLSSVFEKRSFTSDVVSTADSFKSWDTCMDNKTCKIVAIVGIVLAVLFVFWIISSIINCICCGANCIRSLFCCCCNGGGRYRGREVQEKDLYNNPNMYPPRTQGYAYQPPMTMQNSYQQLPSKGPNSYGYVRDFDDDGVPSDSSVSQTTPQHHNNGNSAAEYYNSSSGQKPYSPLNNGNNGSNPYRGQNTYF